MLSTLLAYSPETTPSGKNHHPGRTTIVMSGWTGSIERLHVERPYVVTVVLVTMALVTIVISSYYAGRWSTREGPLGE